MASSRERVRSDGSIAYTAVYRLGGRQRTTTFDDRKSRDRFVSTANRLGLTHALDLLDALDASDGTLTVAEFARQHVDNLSGVKDSTRRRYRAMIDRDLGRLADLPLDLLDRDVVRRWVNELDRSGASAKTVKNKHGFLSGVCKDAVVRGLIPANPCERVRLPKGTREEMTFLSPDEFARLIDVVPEHYRPLVTTLVTTGLRWGEATALQVRDVDLDAATLRVSRAWSDDDDGWQVGPPKTTRGLRTVALAPEVVAMLVPLVDGRPPEAWVFTTPTGRVIRPTTFHDGVWQPVVRLANGEPPFPDRKRAIRSTSVLAGIAPAAKPLGKRPRIHDLRHTAASWLIARGADLMTVQYTLGHESITTTSDRYGHLLPERRAAVAAAMSSMIAQAFPTLENGGAQPLAIEGR